MWFCKAEGLTEIERAQHVKYILYQFCKNSHAQQCNYQLRGMLRAYNLRKSRAKFSVRTSSPICASAVSLARTHERAAKPRGAEEIGELARWLGKVRRFARLHALLLPAPYIFLVFSMHITRETMSSNLIIIFYLILLTTKQITF